VGVQGYPCSHASGYGGFQFYVGDIQGYTLRLAISEYSKADAGDYVFGLGIFRCLRSLSRFSRQEQGGNSFTPDLCGGDVGKDTFGPIHLGETTFGCQLDNGLSQLSGTKRDNHRCGFGGSLYVFENNSGHRKSIYGKRIANQELKKKNEKLKMKTENSTNIFFKLTNLDRRYIYLLIGIAVFIPLIFPLRLPLGVTPESEALFDKVESLKEGSVVMLTFDYYPSTLPETQPMSYAALKHLFKKNIKVITLTTVPLGALSVMEGVVDSVAGEYHKKYGVDYVNLGYKYGSDAVMLGMGKKISDIFPQDNYDNPLEDLPLMQKVKNYRNVDFIFIVSDNATVDYWVSLVNARFGTPMGAGVTAVMAPKCYSYLQTKQLVGLLGGMKGAAEYEKLSKNYGRAMVGMDPQSIIHLLIIFFIVIGNIGYFVTKKSK